MARITWQNVTAPDLSTSRAALQQAGNSFNRGFEGFADTFRDIEQQQKDAYSQEALARLAQVSDPNQLNQMMASGGLASLGITDPRYLNADAMQNILGRPKTLFDNQNTAANTANTMSTMRRRDALLQGEIDQAAANLGLTNAQTGLTYAQTDQTRQNMDFAAQKLPKNLALLDQQIAQTKSQIEIAQNQDQREADRLKRELTVLEEQKDRVINSDNISQLIAGYSTLDEARADWPRLQRMIQSNPLGYSDRVKATVFGGADAAVGERLSLAAAADITAAGNAFWDSIKNSEDYRGSTEEEIAQRIELSDQPRAVKDVALQKLESVDDAFFKASAAAKAKVSGTKSGSTASAFNENVIILQNDLTREATQDPLHEFAKYWDNDPDSAIVGAAERLREKLRGKDRVFSGADNARVTRQINLATRELADLQIPADAIAYLVEKGFGDEDNMWGTRMFQGEVDINRNAIKAAAIRLYSPESRDRASQTYASWKARSNELSEINSAAQAIIMKAELKISQTTDKSLHPGIIAEMNKALAELGLPSRDQNNSQPTIQLTPFSSVERTPLDRRTN